MTNLLYPIFVIGLVDHFPGYDAKPIQGGQPDQDNEVIWQVSFQRQRRDGTWQHFCGGSIISNKHIVTAAHCFVRFGKVNETHVWDRRKKSRIVIGTNDLNSSANPAFSLKIDKVIVPRAYTKLRGRTALADIAVIKVKHPIELSRNIGKYGLIDLFDPKGESERKRYDDQEGFVSGFGATKVKCRTDGTITLMFDRTRNILSVQLTDHRCPKLRGLRCVRYVKGGEQARGACCGDSGGPLYYRSDDKFELVGVISGGPADCDIRTSCNKVAKVMFIPDYKNFLNEARTLNLNTTFPEMSVEDFKESGVDYIVLPDQAELARKYYVRLIEKKKAEKRRHC